MSYWDEVFADSPTILLKLDEASGTLVDAAVGNDGTPNGGLTYRVAGPDATGIPYGLAFNGSTGWVSVAAGTDLDLGDNFTIEFWLKRNVLSTWQFVLGKGTSAYATGFNTGDYWVLWRPGTGQVAQDSYTIDTNWHHYVTSKSGATVHFYKDKVETTDIINGGTYVNNALVLEIGRSNATDYLSGSLAGVALYKSVLSPLRIAAHYDARSTGSGGGGAAFIRADAAVGAEVQTILVTPVETAAGVEVSAATTADAVTAKVATEAAVASETPAIIVRPVVTPAPALHARIDWDNNGNFTGTYDDLAGRVLDCNWTRGRSADFSAEATGAATILLDNFDDLYTPGGGGPLDGLLVPGRPVHIYSMFLGVDDPHFFGYIERLTPNPADRKMTITCYDVLRRLSETDVVVPAHAYVQRSARDFRREVLEDYERASPNLCHNGSVETAITGWGNGTTGTTVSRITTDGYFGSACVEAAAPSVFARTEFPLRLAPVFFAGQTYRFSVYLKWVSGATALTIGAYGGAWTGAGIADRSVTLTGTWTRVTFTVTLPATYTAGSPLAFFGLSPAAQTYRLDGLMVTRGQAENVYSDTGTIGRWPNWCGNGSFDGGALNGWVRGYANLIANPSFEVDTTGWVTNSGGATLSRQTADPFAGVGYGQVVTNATATNYEAYFAITYTFLAGVTYDITVTLKHSSGGRQIRAGIKSAGTPTDITVGSYGQPSSYTRYALTWTPSATRTDARVFAETDTAPSITTFFIDAVAVTVRDSSESAGQSLYANDGPNGGLAEPTSRTIGTTAKYGSKALEFVAPATAKVGMAYDFSHWGGYFMAGQPYTASVWVRVSSGTGSIKMGMAAVKADGTHEEATVTNAAVGTTFVQLTATWTPSADYFAAVGTVKRLVLYVCQTDAVARTIYVDGVRVIPAAGGDDYELSQWSLDIESDTYSTSAQLSGSAASSLSRVNGLSLSRHYIRPRMSSPFYAYVTSSRDTLAGKTSAETFADDLADMTAADIDRASIVNHIAVGHSLGTDYYSDLTSIDKYGLRPGSAISGGAFYSGRTVPDVVGPALITRYKDPRARPTVTIVNRWPSQLQRELDDLVTVNFARLRIAGGKYLIARLETKVSESGQRWETTYVLEEWSG